MLHDPSRHQSLLERRWDEDYVREAIGRIVADTEANFSAETFWPMHPRDVDDGDNAPAWPLYHGASGVIWALDYLQALGAITLARDYAPFVETVRMRIGEWLATFGGNASSYLMGELPSLMLDYGMRRQGETLDELATLIESNIDHPARELMWGSPGTMLAALLLHEHIGDARFAELFRTTASKLHSQLEWSDEFGCAYWTQDLYGQRSTYLDAVHGFVATALPLIHGRHLLDAAAWNDWAATIANTIRATATHEEGRVNWRPFLTPPPRRSLLMQFCHGAPGFVICLADM
ncbi:MAG TPA: lanthionine synthetase LanC family protein, partial [Casimicrobiaceae bacterium]|nr:lanthionine synthetase LanC family protein [Casimicrobiaceae bacterium]